jgi:hypothetical protein
VQTCAQCRQLLPRTRFSKTQLERKQHSQRRCAACIAAGPRLRRYTKTQVFVYTDLVRSKAPIAVELELRGSHT